jgi:hypothetical protein
MRARPAATDYRNVSREVASLSPAVFVSSVRATENRGSNGTMHDVARHGTSI